MVNLGSLCLIMAAAVFATYCQYCCMKCSNRCIYVCQHVFTSTELASFETVGFKPIRKVVQLTPFCETGPWRFNPNNPTTPANLQLNLQASEKFLLKFHNENVSIVPVALEAMTKARSVWKQNVVGCNGRSGRWVENHLPRENHVTGLVSFWGEKNKKKQVFPPCLFCKFIPN